MYCHSTFHPYQPNHHTVQCHTMPYITSHHTSETTTTQTTPPRSSLINTSTCEPTTTHPPTHQNSQLQVLEELAISLKHNLVSKLPFCAFNGGNDVFVDVGNKSLGLDALMRFLDAYPYEVGGLWGWG
jgi:hypothetical protein